jgi:hypothetical protein
MKHRVPVVFLLGVRLCVLALCVSTVSLLCCVQAVGVLLNSVPETVKFEGVLEELAAVQGVASVHDLHIWAISSKTVRRAGTSTPPARLPTRPSQPRLLRVLRFCVVSLGQSLCVSLSPASRRRRCPCTSWRSTPRTC